MINLANSVSSLRALLVIPWFVFPDLNIRIIIATIALASDWLDGFIARKTGSESPFGIRLDTFCDKCFLLPTLMSLLLQQDIHIQLLGFALFRDILLVLSWIGTKIFSISIEYKSRKLSKTVTAFQFAFVIAILVQLPYLEIGAQGIAVLGVMAVVDYWMNNVQRKTRI